MNKNSNARNISYRVVLIAIVYIYSLFALDRIKSIFTFKVDGISTTNEIWLILIISLLLLVGNKQQVKMAKSSIKLIMLTVILLIFFLIGGFKAVSLSQWVYAGLLFFTPLIMYLSIPSLTYLEKLTLIKLFVATSLIYSIFAIVLSSNYAYFMSLIGNPVDDYRYFSQYRASMMIGSSITVSYFFNISLPFCFYLFYTTQEKFWKRLSLLAIIINILATFILLSRLASLSAIIITLFYFIFVRAGIKKNHKQKILLFIVTIIGLYIIFNNFDLSRLLIKINFNNDSVESRGTAARLGLSIFSDNPIIGSGMGRYYLRAYSNKLISYNGLSGLIDPHNLFILIISEFGIVGSAIISYLFLYLIILTSKITEKNIKKTAFVVVFIMLLNSMGGSQLFNEISFSIIFWIYMSIFKLYPTKIIK